MLQDRRFHREELDTPDEVLAEFQNFYDQVRKEFEQMDFRMTALEKKKKNKTSKKKNTEKVSVKRKGFVMKKVMVLILLLGLLVAFARADVDLTTINNDTMSTRDAIIDRLRILFSQVNTDVDEVSGFNNKGTGNWFYVDSGRSNVAAVDGTTWARAEATVERANSGGELTANNQDVVFIAEGHAENLSTADAIDMDTAGVTYIGLGEGNSRPTFTYTAAAGEIVFGAANCVFYNCRFVPATDSITMGISVEAGGDNCYLINCEFVEPSTATDEFVDAIDLASGADNFHVYNCTYRHCSATGPAHFIEAGNGTNYDCKFVGNDIEGQFSVSAIWSDTVDLRTRITNNRIVQMTSGQHCIEYTTTATGLIADNQCYADAEATSIDPGSMYCFNNLVSTAINASGVVYPAPDDTTTNLLGVNDADNAAVTSSVAANADGSVLERLEYLQAFPGTDSSTNYIGTNDADHQASTSSVASNVDGTVLERLEYLQRFSDNILVVVSSVTCTSIPSNTQTSGAITATSTGGLILTQIIINIGTTGWAGPTNFEFSTNNVRGDTGADDPIVVEAAAGLATSTSWVCTDDATSHQLPLYLEPGRRIFLHGDDSAGITSGVGQVIMYFRRVTDDAIITAQDGPGA